jgi:hypothetical protein
VLFEDGVHSFGLAVSFRSVYDYYSSRELKSLRKVFLELVNKADVSVGYNGNRGAI